MMLLGWVLAFVAVLAAVRAASSLDRDFCQMPTAKVDFTESTKMAAKKPANAAFVSQKHPSAKPSQETLTAYRPVWYTVPAHTSKKSKRP